MVAIAAVHNFNFKKRCYSYQSGFSSSDDKRFSPMVVFDILEIQAGTYKQNFKNKNKE